MDSRMSSDDGALAGRTEDQRCVQLRLEKLGIRSRVEDCTKPANDAGRVDYSAAGGCCAPLYGSSRALC
jgi:hypothetical protein